MKKTLMIHTYGGIGGAGQSLLEIIDSLEDKENLVVCCPKNPSTMLIELKKRNIKTYEIENPLPTYAHYSGVSLSKLNVLFYFRVLKIFTKGIKKLRKIIEETKPEVVAVNSMTFCWIGPFINSKIKKICFHRETYLNTFFNIRTNLLKKLLTKYFDKIIFISKYDLDSTEGLKENQGLVIKDSVSLIDSEESLESVLKRFNLNKNDKYILFVGGYNRIKGGDTAVKAISHIKNPKIKLLFVPGKMSLENNKKLIRDVLKLNQEITINEYIKKKCLENRVIMLPSQINMKPLYKVASIIIFPSKYPHQARPIFEGGLFGKPAIITRFAETEENLIENYNGLYFEKNNSQDLAIKIEKLINKTELLKELGENNFDMTKENHNMDNFKLKINEIFKQI